MHVHIEIKTIDTRKIVRYLLWERLPGKLSPQGVLFFFPEIHKLVIIGDSPT